MKAKKITTTTHLVPDHWVHERKYLETDLTFANMYEVVALKVPLR